jgi:2-dehydro-3-deoxyglucarate aldolase/4-hydroxy-2-oxoheptanedioate aldolase
MGRRLQELLAQDKVTRVFAVGQICDPKIIEILGMEGGFDGVWLDNEHAGITIAQIENATRAARGAGLETFVRLAATDYASVMRPLEAGAGGIMAAQVKSARETADIVRWAKFHPQGLRGFNGSGYDGRYATLPPKDYVAKANAETLIAIQIENVEALAEVEQIAAVPHVDVLFIGPADLSQSMGILGDWANPRLWEGIERVAQAAKSHGIHWAILPLDAEFARRCVALGCRMLSLGLDTWVVQRGIRAFKKEFASYFE